MNKYDKGLIFRYVTGNDILNYDISYLENDINFMIEVFNYTNDIKYYDICSDNLKNNYNFVLFLIDKFEDNLDFIEKVALNYQNNLNNNITNIELYIIMYNKFKNTKRKEFDKYKLYLDNIYYININKIKLLKDIYKDDYEMLEIIKNSFSFIEDDYKDSSIIKTYFAKRMLNEILDINNVDTKNILLKLNYGNDINKKIIKYISLYDPSLAIYLLGNLKLLKPYINLIDDKNNIINNNRIDLLNKIDIYLDLYKDEIKTSKEKMLYYFAYKLNIVDVLVNNNFISKEVIEEYKKVNIDTFLFSDKIIYLKDYIHIKNINHTILHKSNKKIKKYN